MQRRWRTLQAQSNPRTAYHRFAQRTLISDPQISVICVNQWWGLWRDVKGLNTECILSSTSRQLPVELQLFLFETDENCHILTAFGIHDAGDDFPLALCQLRTMTQRIHCSLH